MKVSAMPPATIARPRVGQPYRFTVAEYHKLGEAAVLGKRGVELLEGEIIHMSPIGHRHLLTVSRLNKHFVLRAKDRYDVHPGGAITLNDLSEPQPDVMLVQPEAEVPEKRLPVPEVTHLVIEVADASLRYDRGRKLRAYARAGVPELWIVNLRDDCVELYREPMSGKYRWTRTARGREKVAPARFPDAAIAVEKVIP